MAVEIAEAAARGVAEAMRSSSREKPAEKPDKLEPEIKPEDLPEDYAEYFEALDLLPKIDPKYQGRNLKRELAEASRKETSYRKTWEKKNPGETFIATRPITPSSTPPSSRPSSRRIFAGRIASSSASAPRRTRSAASSRRSDPTSRR